MSESNVETLEKALGLTMSLSLSCLCVSLCLSFSVLQVYWVCCLISLRPMPLPWDPQSCELLWTPRERLIGWTFRWGQITHTGPNHLAPPVRPLPHPAGHTAESPEPPPQVPLPGQELPSGHRKSSSWWSRDPRTPAWGSSPPPGLL